MISRPDSCKGCPLHETSVPGFVPDTIAEHAEYVYFGEAPGKDEITQGKPFVGRAGFVLKNWLTKAVPTLQIALEKGRVTIANTLRCLPPEHQGRAYPRGEEKEVAERTCRQYDNLGAAHTIILFGEHSQRYWFREELLAEDTVDRALGRDIKGVLGRIGRVYNKNNRRFVFAPHPAWVLRQPSLVEHGQAALKIAANTETTAEVDYIGWDAAIKEMF
jgi:uracil-DNA glycosylase family 4